MNQLHFLLQRGPFQEVFLKMWLWLEWSIDIITGIKLGPQDREASQERMQIPLFFNSSHHFLDNNSNQQECQRSEILLYVKLSKSTTGLWKLLKCVPCYSDIT